MFGGSRRIGYALILPVLIVFIVYLSDIAHAMLKGEHDDDDNKKANYVNMGVYIGGILLALLSMLNLAKMPVMEEEGYVHEHAD